MNLFIRPVNRQTYLLTFEKRMGEGIRFFPCRDFMPLYNRTKNDAPDVWMDLCVYRIENALQIRNKSLFLFYGKRLLFYDGFPSASGERIFRRKGRPKYIERYFMTLEWLQQTSNRDHSPKDWLPQIARDNSVITGWVSSIAGRKSVITGWVPSIAGRKSVMTGWVSSIAGRKSVVTEWVPPIAGRKSVVTEWVPPIAGRKSVITEWVLSIAGRESVVTEWVSSITERKSVMTEWLTGNFLPFFFFYLVTFYYSLYKNNIS